MPADVAGLIQNRFDWLNPQADILQLVAQDLALKAVDPFVAVRHRAGKVCNAAFAPGQRRRAYSRIKQSLGPATYAIPNGGYTKCSSLKAAARRFVAPTTASLPLELAVPTQRSPWRFSSRPTAPLGGFNWSTQRSG